MGEMTLPYLQVSSAYSLGQALAPGMALRQCCPVAGIPQSKYFLAVPLSFPWGGLLLAFGSLRHGKLKQCPTIFSRSDRIER